jgi:hypothetical protein
MAGRSRPTHQTHSGPAGEATNGDLSCTAWASFRRLACVRVTSPAVGLPCRPSWLHPCAGCGPLLPSSRSPSGGRPGDGRESSSRNARPIRDARPPSLRAGPFSRALRRGISAGYTHPILLTTGVVNGAFSYLNGCLPLAERAAACSGSGGGLALACSPPRGWGDKVPETPRDLCALGVDEVCG